MTKVLRETAVATERYTAKIPLEDLDGVPWPWNVPDGEWTWDLYCQLPMDGNRYEVIGGKLSLSPSPSRSHQRVLLKLALFLEGWAGRTGAGEVYPGPFDVILPLATPKTGYAEPDLLFVRRERLSVVTAKNVQGAPDLVIEILSPSTARADWVDKQTAYQQGGVVHYWVVDPEKQILTTFRLEEGQYKLAGRYENDAVFEPEGFPGLRVILAKVWE